MIKAVFMSEGGSRELLDRVYAGDNRARIGARATLHPDVIGRDNLEAHQACLREAQVVFATWGMPALSEADIARYLPCLKAVFYAAGSVQGFARPFLNRGVAVASAWAANAVPVAEYTLAQILLANKGFFQNSRRAKADYAAARHYSDTFSGNYAATVGILGAGMIGGKVIELLKPFHLDVWVYDPFLDAARAAALGVEKHSLEEIFTHCQTVSNHLANLPATAGILNREHFDRMPPNATFINTGRGAQVVEADLIAALQAAPGRTAVLDVTDPEPPAPGSALRALENVVLTSHIAGSLGREIERLGCYMADEFERYAAGLPLRYQVSLKMLETMA